jgi:hypothetical protein
MPLLFGLHGCKAPGNNIPCNIQVSEDGSK